MKNNLRELRKKNNMSQSDVLIKTGISITTISQLETGRRDIKDVAFETALKFAKCFNCTTEDLINTEE